MLDAKWSVSNESFIFCEIQGFFCIWNRDIKIVIILTSTLKNGWRIVIYAWHLVNFLILRIYFWEAVFKGRLVSGILRRSYKFWISLLICLLYREIKNMVTCFPSILTILKLEVYFLYFRLVVYATEWLQTDTTSETENS